MISAIDDAQRKAAKVAGVACLFAAAITIFAHYGIYLRLLVPGNALDTARNILANETAFRVVVVCELIYSAATVVLLVALYTILKPVNRGLALVAALFRLLFASLFVVTALNLLGALRLLGDASYLPVFEAGQLQTLARLHLAAGFDTYYVGLPFWALASTLCSYQWFTSRYIPSALAGFGVIASAWCVLCAFAYLIFPTFENVVDPLWYDLAMFVFEIALSFWLLFMGLKPSASLERA